MILNILFKFGFECIKRTYVSNFDGKAVPFGCFLAGLLLERPGVDGILEIRLLFFVVSRASCTSAILSYLILYHCPAFNKRQYYI